MKSKLNQVINSQRKRNISYVVCFVFILALFLPWTCGHKHTQSVSSRWMATESFIYIHFTSFHLSHAVIVYIFGIIYLIRSLCVRFCLKNKSVVSNGPFSSRSLLFECFYHRRSSTVRPSTAAGQK